MCMIVGEEFISVSNTNIFARGLEYGRQVLVYSMNIAAGDDQAMILPIPVPAGSPDAAVRFINLDHSPAFFSALNDCFPVMLSRSSGEGTADFSLGAVAAEVPLEVHKVGAYEASFVPSSQDWGRIDPCFRLPDQIWSQLPQYADWGFVVFQINLKELAPGVGASPQSIDGVEAMSLDPETHGVMILDETGLTPMFDAPGHDVHPMAFTFPRREPADLFFPTVHVHNGRYDPEASFDHALYWQAELESGAAAAAERSEPLREAMLATHEVNPRLLAEANVLDLDGVCFRRKLRGPHPNQDIVLR